MGIRMDGQSLTKQMDQLLSMKKGDEAEKLLAENGAVAKHDRKLVKIYYLLPVCTAEREAGQRTLFTKVSGIDELLERDTKVKFYLRRIAFDVLDDEQEFFRFCAQYQVSLPELFIETYCNAVHREKVQSFIQKKIAEGKLKV
ncbi:MAG: hypothetical protein HDR04_08220 [Lachnospiraceae bacterium]|nr:hypothetical protein [Lachnospiraceae bacterium]